MATTPSQTKTYTKEYQSFKGVDLTNDETNVWYRRSPSGINMLPDASGRPFKRHGWEIVISKESLIEIYGSPVNDFAINRCYYFELGGITHIMIFTSVALFLCKFTGDELEYDISKLSTDNDLIGSYDRTFFFEGNGKSAFYIYGGYKVWCYSENGFENVTNSVTLPTILIGKNADGDGGTKLDSFNLLSSLVAEQFQNNVYSCNAVSSNVGLTVSVDSSVFATKHTTSVAKVFTYTTEWSEDLEEYGITVSGTPASGDTITVTLGLRTYIYGTVPQTNVSKVKVYTLDSDGAFENELDVYDSTHTLATGECKLSADGTYIEYHDVFLPLVEGEDSIRIIHPKDSITYTNHATSAMTVTAKAGE